MPTTLYSPKFPPSDANSHIVLKSDGLGFGDYNAEENWTNNWGDFEGMKDVGWGLINIGYMF